jgi:hypothetical protein
VYIKGTSRRSYNIVLFSFKVHLVILWDQNRDDNNMLVKPVTASWAFVWQGRKVLPFTLLFTRNNEFYTSKIGLFCDLYSLLSVGDQMYVPSMQFQAVGVDIKPISLVKQLHSTKRIHLKTGRHGVRVQVEQAP